MKLILPTLAVVVVMAAAPRPASAPTPRPPIKTCGEGSWTITDLKHGGTLFAGKADCTTVESNPYVRSLMAPDKDGVDQFELWVTYTVAGESHCGDANKFVSVRLTGGYYAGEGNPPPPGSKCEFSINPLPRSPGLVSGGLTAVLGRCSKAGGCGKPDDWDLVSVNGSFDAYSRGTD